MTGKFATWKFNRSLLGTCFLGFVFLTGCQKAQAPSMVGEATVNGEKIAPSELYSALMLADGSNVLSRLVEQKLILQEAKKLNIKADDEDYNAQLEHFKEQIGKNPNLFKVAEQELKARTLLKKLLLKDVTEAQKQAFYKDFGEELKQYELYEIIVPNKDVADQVVGSLRSGANFETLVATSSIDNKTKNQKGRLGFATWRTIASLFNQEIANTVEKLKPGAVTAPLPLEDGGFVLFKLGGVRASYDELKSSIENHFADAGRASYMYHLISEASIDSPYMPKAADGASVEKPTAEKAARAPKQEPAVVAPGPNAGADPAIPLPKDNDVVPVPK